MEPAGFSCFINRIFIPGSHSLLTKHFKTRHGMKTSNATRAVFVCGQNGCTSTFVTFANYRYHLVKVCENVLRRDLSLPVEIPVEVDQQQLPQQDTLQQEGGHTTIAEACHTVSKSVDFTNEVAKLMLALRLEHNETHAALHCICKGLQNIFLQIDQQDNADALACATLSLKNLDSQKKTVDYFSQHFDFIKPYELQVMPSQDIHDGIVGATPTLVNHSFHYIPLRKTLSRLFSDEQFFQLYHSEKLREDGWIRCHRDSVHFREHPLFSINPFALRLQVFFDDL